MVTFGIDIALLACYLLILVKFENFWFVLLILALVFCLYVLWDGFHSRQYPLKTKCHAELKPFQDFSFYCLHYYSSFTGLWGLRVVERFLQTQPS